jgi:hypothetical protein
LGAETDRELTWRDGRLALPFIGLQGRPELAAPPQVADQGDGILDGQLRPPIRW